MRHIVDSSYARIYVERRSNDVIVETCITDDEIRYSVRQRGVVLFNKALEGKYNQRRAGELARQQEHAAVLAERE
jgi:hypothetical protein